MSRLVILLLLFAQTITWPPGKITLDDGTTCSFIFGATFAVDGARADYNCGDGRWLPSGMYEDSDTGNVMITVLIFDRTTGRGSYAGQAQVQSTSCSAISHSPNVDSEIVC